MSYHGIALCVYWLLCQYVAYNVPMPNEGRSLHTWYPTLTPNRSDLYVKYVNFYLTMKVRYRCNTKVKHILSTDRDLSYYKCIFSMENFIWFLCILLTAIQHHKLQKKPLVSDPGMHHGTCVTHVPWCMSGSLTRGDGENVPGIPGACAILNFTYLARDPMVQVLALMDGRHAIIWTKDESFHRRIYMRVLGTQFAIKFAIMKVAVCPFSIESPYLSSYPGYFRKPHWFSKWLPEYIQGSWQVCKLTILSMCYMHKAEKIILHELFSFS